MSESAGSSPLPTAEAMSTVKPSPYHGYQGFTTGASRVPEALKPGPLAAGRGRGRWLLTRNLPHALTTGARGDAARP